MYQKKGLYLEYARAVKEVVDVPVFCAGRMDDPDMSSEAVSKGWIDIVSLGRPLLADPQWWVRYRTAQALQHLLAGAEGRLAQVRDAQEDRYARDILTQVMAERALGETQ